MGCNTEVKVNKTWTRKTSASTSEAAFFVTSKSCSRWWSFLSGRTSYFHNYIIHVFSSKIILRLYIEPLALIRCGPLTLTLPLHAHSILFFVGWAISRCLSTSPHPINRARGKYTSCTLLYDHI